MSSNEKAMVWSARRSRQWGRFGGRLGKVWDKPTTTNVAKAAWSGVKYLRTLVNSEVHKFDVGVTTTTPSTTAVITQLNAIAQGDLSSNRTGNSLLLKYLTMRVAVLASTSANQTLLRIIVFFDKQQIADTAPATTDLLSVNSTLAFLNNNAAGRFQVIDDRFINLDNLSKKSMHYKYYKSFAGSNIHCKYNGAASTDIQKNGLYVAFISNEATNTPSVTGLIRLGYHDN